ncbi:MULTISPECIES: hypothetical protein [unclassified Streptomyces]|uniref:hypothetical protein n=1 Tax=Streptomyces TaxID=1883 RepID=UPI000FDC1318|nr:MULTISPECIES: hypothetical protein [unclassified Streptomyces]UQA36323.1 hypothetical protein KRR37_23370 [Streptomyces sp. HNA39]
MNKCTTVALFDPPDWIVALFASVHRLETRHLFCELGEDHDDDHAAMLWDEGGWPGSAVWARWAGKNMRLASLGWCTALTPKEEACGLFDDHPSAHAWDVTDRTLEAWKRELAKDFPDHFPEYGEGHES